MPLPSRRAFLGASAALLAPDWASAAAPPVRAADTLMLTWRRDPTTTMTVQWVGRPGPAARVHYSPAGGGPWWSEPAGARPYPLTDLRLFRAELTGLCPGAEYRFRVGDDSTCFRFRTMPARATDAISFVSGGDCGVNRHAVANNAQAARQDPMFVLLGGDLAYENGRSAATSLAFLRNFSRHTVAPGGRLIPLVACIGNHEVAGGYGKRRSRAPFFYALFDGLFPETGFASLDFGDYLSLVLLDTGHTSAIGGEQADWLEKTLRARRDHPHVIVANHVPAYPSYRNPRGKGKDGKGGTGEGNRRHWVPLFEKYRVPAVLEHHDHTFKRSRPLLDGRGHDNGVVYLGDGSWGQIRTPNPPERLSYLARASRDYHLSLHRIEGRERFHLALNEAGRVMDVCRTGQRKTGMVRASG